MTIYEECICRDLYRRVKHPEMPIRVHINRGFLEREDVQNFFNIIDNEEKMYKIMNYVKHEQAAEVR